MRQATLGWQVVLGLLAGLGPLAASVPCSLEAGPIELELPAGANEVRCTTELDLGTDTRWIRYTATFKPTEVGVFEAEIVSTIRRVVYDGEELSRSEWPETLAEHGAGAFIYYSYDGEQGGRRFHRLLRSSRGIEVRAAKLDYNWVDRYRVEVQQELILRRLQRACWVVGTVAGVAGGVEVSGDYAFWSDNPTGILLEEDELPVPDEEEEQEIMEGMANLDTEALAAAGLPLDQLQAAVAAAQEATAGAAGEAASESEATAMGLVETLEADARTFLTLESVRNDDDIELVGGASAGIAGDLSLVDLARGAGHILSKFALTLELEGSVDVADPQELWGLQPSVHRAGFMHRGRMFAYPRDGGPRPVVQFGRCPGETASTGTVCGRVDWQGKAQVVFGAGPGVFSCIGN